MTYSPGYRIEWRANQRGTWAHAVITDVHEWVSTAIFENPDGGSYDLDDLARTLADCPSRNRLVRPARPSDTQCANCIRIVAELDDGIDSARRSWAISKLDSAVDVLASVAPIGWPEHVTPG